MSDFAVDGVPKLVLFSLGVTKNSVVESQKMRKGGTIGIGTGR